ncbi:LapA family protein [Maribacter polysaccharolyticus]|uniref:LapA family protein n=1 Tax=Maribacter polysaccharolyticus TaxID=3020831 RepID=UPI00237FD05E|nr:LapA family protein [Maribacter polysaccharolyticus]MDE3740292.1 LapA family protein [Maribacter polysaccharolyticus]
MKFKTIMAIIAATLVVVFSLQNTDVTDVRFLIWKLSMSRVLVILGSFVIGVIVGILVSLKKKMVPKE